METKNTTVGQKIDYKVKSYIELYESLAKDKTLNISAAKLARADLIVNKFIAEQVLKGFDSEMKKRGVNFDA
jgi:hypothetical protein